MKLDRNNPERILWECGGCRGINAWNWDDAERASRLLKVEVKSAHGSCFDNICGHCGLNWVHRDSPIMAECYTHEERNEIEELTGESLKDMGLEEHAEEMEED